MPPANFSRGLAHSYHPTSSLLLSTRCSAAAPLPHAHPLAPCASSPIPSSILSPSTRHQQTRSATYIPRPRRPYQFTQLIHLSDGSTFTVRTTSPAPVFRSAVDTRNHLLWQPSEKSLQNVEVDEAGRLAAFRSRFGRAFDLTVEDVRTAGRKGTEGVQEAQDGDAGSAGQQAQGQAAEEAAAAAAEEPWEEGEEEESLADLISGYAKTMDQQEPKKKRRPPSGQKGGAKGGKK